MELFSCRAPRSVEVFYVAGVRNRLTSVRPVWDIFGISWCQIYIQTQLNTLQFMDYYEITMSTLGAILEGYFLFQNFFIFSIFSKLCSQ